MRVVILTQNDPFYLAENLNYLFHKMPGNVEVAGCVVFDASPFGKRESFFQKMLKTWAIFGSGFFIKYGFRFLRSKLDPGKSVVNILKKYKIPLIEINSSINSTESLEKIRRIEPDLLISIAGNQIFKKRLIQLAPKGCLNLHTALLPKYRGLMPSFWVLRNNERYTGVSVFFVDEGIDSGPVIVQKKVEIGKRTQEELIKDTKKLGMDAIVEAIELIVAGNFELIANDDADSTYFSFPTKEDVAEFRKKGKRFY